MSLGAFLTFPAVLHLIKDEILQSSPKPLPNPTHTHTHTSLFLSSSSFLSTACQGWKELRSCLLQLPHFTQLETEAQRGKELAQGHTAVRGRARTRTPGSQAALSEVLSCTFPPLSFPLPSPSCCLSSPVGASWGTAQSLGNSHPLLPQALSLQGSAEVHVTWTPRRV